MPIFSVDDLRKQAGSAWDSASDADLISAYAKQIGADPADVAYNLRYDLTPGGKNANRMSSSVDRYQANLYGVGEEVAKGVGLDSAANWLGERRRTNELQADVATRRAREQGAIESWDEVNGLRDFGDYAVGLGIQSAPYLGESIVGGLGARVAMGGTRAALRGAEAAGDLAGAARAKRALDIGSSVGGVAASYPSSVGDILSNQREQSGTTDGVAAGVLGLGYAALNAVGLEGAAARSTAFRNPLNLLDNVGGIKGGVARMGATALKTGVVEGATETGQEVINQVGRMAVDPTATLDSDDALNRYKESFIGGAVLGGGTSAALGGWRRSSQSFIEGANTGTVDTNPTAPASDVGQVIQSQAPAVPTPPAAPITAPVVQGGTSDIAVANQQQQQQEVETQRALQEQARRETAFETIGAALTTDNGGTLTVFGKPVMGARIAPFGNELARQLEALPPHTQAIIKAIGEAHGVTGNKLVNFSFNANNPVGSAGQLLKTLNKVAEKFQINDAQNEQQAAEILNKLSETAKGAQLEQINAIYQALTGGDTAGYLASQVSQPKGASNGSVQQQVQQQNPAGLGTVREQGAAGEASSGDAGDVRPGGVQPVQSGSVPEGSLGLQTGQLPGEGIRAGSGDGSAVGGGAANQTSEVTNEQDQATAQSGGTQDVVGSTPVRGQGLQSTGTETSRPAARQEAEVTAGREAWNDMDASGVSYDQVPDNLKEAWERAVAEGKATGEVQEAIAKEAADLSAEAQAQKLVRRILDLVIVPTSRMKPEMAAKKREFVAAYFGGARLDKLTEVATSLGISKDQAKRWSAELPNFVEKYAEKLRAALDTAAAELDLTTEQVRDAMEALAGRQESQAVVAEEDTGQTTTAAEEPVESDNDQRKEPNAEDEATDEGQVDERDTTLIQRDRKSESIQEQFNATETNNAAILRTLEELEDAKEKGDDAKVDELQAKVDELIAQGTKQYEENKRRVRATAGKETKNAVQEQGAGEVDVRQEAGNGKKVGKRNAKSEKPAEQGVQTAAEKAAQAWDQVAKEIPGAPTFAELTEAQREDFIEYGEENWTPDDVRTELVRLNAKFGQDGRATDPYTVADLTKEISDFVRTAVSVRKLKIVQSVADLLQSSDPLEQKLGAAMALNRAFGVASNGRAYLIANRISKGQGRAKFMHEVGVHLGMEGLLTDQQFDDLTDQIFAWAQRDDDSREATLARRAIARADAAQTADEDLRSEILAYFVEEAMQDGIEPSAAMKLAGPLGKWFRTLYAAFKVAIRRLGMNPDKMNAQDVVNLAYGAARLEMHGTYHGTAAEFRKFNHKYMGSGEGAQAYGWGTYLAQRFGIAKGYWKADVQRKVQPALNDAAYSVGGLTNAQQQQQYRSDGGTPIKLGLTLNPLRVRSSGLYIPTIEVTGSKTPGALSYKAADQIFKEDGSQLFSEQQIAQMLDYVKQASSAPEGNVMRVDIAVDQSELLNWDRKLSKQPDVLAKLEANMSNSMKEALVEETNLDLDEMTGEDLYRGLEFLEKKEGLVSEQFGVEDYNKRLATTQAKQIVSVYLDEVVGIPGLKFYDAESRSKPENEIVFNGKQYSRTDLINMKRDDGSSLPLDQITILRHLLRHGFDQTMKELEGTLERNIQRSMDITKDVYAKYGFPYVESEARKDAERRNEKSYEALQIKFLKENKNNISVVNPKDTRTQNLVIFNDKNIFRVGSRGNNERNKMKFGVAADAYQALPDPVKKKADYVSTNLREAGRKGVLAAAITEDVVDMAKKYMESATDYLKAQYARQKTRLEFELRIERILSSFDKLNDATKKAVNEFIADSTKEGVWGYAPSYNPKVKIDDAMKSRFEAMPAAAQRVIQDTFDHGYQALQLKQKAVKDAANREFAERIKAANGNQQELNEIRLDKMAFENKFNRLLNIKNDKPYAYMGRYGDYVVVAKSAEYLEAEKLAREGDTAAAEWLTEHQADGDHYFVAFGETQGDVDQIKAELDASGMYDRTYAAQKIDKGAYTGGDDLFLAVTRLSRMLARKAKNDITGSLDGDSLKSLNKMIGDLYLATVAEASAHTASLQRKNVAGFDRDMMRNLATRGRADAHFLASLEHNEKITDTIEAMIDESENDPGRARPYLNELLKRHANSMDYKTPSPLATTLTRMSNIWFLATSPAFYLQQILQTAVLSQPYLSGRLGYFRSMRAIKKAYADVAPLVKGLGLNDHVDFSKAPEDVRTMLNELVGMGKIDLGIDSDAKARAGDQGVLAKAMYKLQGVNTRIETINRAAAAIAAYRGYLDRYKNGDRAAATKFAAEVVSNTHGSYDGFNTPRLLSTDTGRVLFQFKRFQIIQLSMLMKLMSNAFKGASKEERAIARRALAFIGGHMAVLGGALGVPFVSQIAWAMSKLFGDPDEPDDFEFKLRRMIGDESMANLLLKGVPAFLGVDLSGKLAMQNVASVLPFNEGDISSRSGMEKTLVALMGPSAALSLKFADALGLMTKGDYYKGLEQALPSGMANALKGARFATEGVTMRNGDLVLPAEDVSLFDAAFQAVGLPTDTLTGRQRLQNYKAEFDDFYNTRTSELKQQYTKAAREGDSTTMAEAREEWKQLQESRARNGYTRQPLSTLLKAPNEAAKRARNNIDGVQFNKQSVGFGRQFSNI